VHDDISKDGNVHEDDCDDNNADDSHFMTKKMRL
jgi:hypothetical protein